MRTSGFLCALLLIAAACSSSDGTAPLVATSLTVSASPTQISVNGTAQASAIVKDQNGNALTGQTITWSSLTPTIASVDATTGVVKGLAAGTATIQGKSGTVTGTGSVLVIAPVASCLSGPTVVNLAVGQAIVVNGSASQGCIKIAATGTVGGAPQQYIVIAANANSIPDQLATFTLKSDTGEVVPASTLLTNPFRVSANLAVQTAAATDALQTSFESKLRLDERRELKIPDAQAAYRARGSQPSQLRTSLAAAIPNVGDKTTFKVPTSCTVFKTVTATVQYISNKAIIYTDDTSPPGGFVASDFQDIANEFDNLIYPTDVSYFGTPLDLDNNGHVIILYTPEVNKLTATSNPGSFVGGFFFVGDLFPATGNGSCAQSNVGEIFYVLTADPSGTIVPNGGGTGNPRSTASVRQGTRGTIAHEFEHMINASNRIASPIEQGFEDVWLDEGLAHFAEDANGRAIKGLPDDANATYEAIVGSTQTALNDYGAFFYQNFARLDRYMLNPGPNSPTSAHADTSLADRGAVWSLLRYAADNYAPGGDVKAFTRALAGGPITGVNNLVTRTGVPFDTLVAGWMIANYADDAGIPGLPAKYTYKSYNMRSVMSGQFISANRLYPLQVTDVTGTGYVASGVRALSGSGDYFRFSRPAASAARSFRLLNADGTAASYSGAAFYILRTQ